MHPERKPMRLPEYDYSLPGAYFITACTMNRELLFVLPEAELAVESAWHSVLDIFANMELGEFVVMPNHVHGIVWIKGEGAYRLHPGMWKIDNDNRRRGGQLPAPTAANPEYETLSNIVGAFKTTAATRINKLRGTIGMAVWQRSFYDRVVRNPRELEQIQIYISQNPSQWTEDRDNPANPEFRASAKSIDGYWNEIFDLHL
jgi:REP element-mobilizing transposase RayT